MSKRDNLVDPADYYPYEEPVHRPVSRVRSKGTPRRPCTACQAEVTDDGIGDLIHASSGRYQCNGRSTVATLGRTPAVVPGTNRPKRNYGRN